MQKIIPNPSRSVLSLPRPSNDRVTSPKSASPVTVNIEHQQAVPKPDTKLDTVSRQEMVSDRSSSATKVSKPRPPKGSTKLKRLVEQAKRINALTAYRFDIVRHWSNEPEAVFHIEAAHRLLGGLLADLQQLSRPIGQQPKIEEPSRR